MSKPKIKKTEYYIAGVKVNKEFYFQDFSQYPVKKALTEKNAQLRMAILSKIGYEKMLSELKYTVLERLSGEELYKKHPIGDYSQQGDLLFVSAPIHEVKYKDLDIVMKNRLKKIEYVLIETIFEGKKIKMLIMNNASHWDIKHYESVGEKCNTVFEAIKFRGKVNCLPATLT